MAAEKETFSTRLPPDAAAEVRGYMASHDLSMADALRRLIREGLEAEHRDDLEERLAELERQVNQPFWKRVL